MIVIVSNTLIIVIKYILYMVAILPIKTLKNLEFDNLGKKTLNLSIFEKSLELKKNFKCSL